jgi:DNA polymerase III subunit chi
VAGTHDGADGMTEVAFHVNVPDPLGYACRLIRKGYLLGMTMLVICEPRQTALLNKQLWAMRSVDFVPHCLGGAMDSVTRRSPVLLSDTDAPASDRAFDVLVNLTAEMPVRFASFGKVLEVVSFEPSALGAARDRWRAYQKAGLEPQRHEARA